MWPCKGFLAGIHIATFLSTHQEWHAMIEGFSDGFCLRDSDYALADNLLEGLRKDHHYYNAGRALGFAGFIVLVTGMAVWFVRAVLGA